MRKLSLFLALFLSMMGIGQVWAQKSLPYSYGFEDNNLATDGWTLNNVANNNGNYVKISTTSKRTGTYGYQLSSYNGGTANQYLVSPELNAPNGLTATFYYKSSHTGTYGTETFRVGYSTTGTDPANFTWDASVNENSATWKTYEKECPAGTKYIAINYTSSNKYYLYVDDFSFSAPVSGPVLAVLDGSSKITSSYNYNFGVTTSGTTKTFTLSNPGTESLTVNIAATNGFGVSPTSATIAAKGETTLNVTMADGTATGTVTITPTAVGVDPFVINVSGTVRDLNKIFVDFEDNGMPSSWTMESGWSITSGYAHAGYTGSYIRSGKISVDYGGETILLKHKGTSSYSSGVLTIYWATTGNDSSADWDSGTSVTTTYNEWNTASVSIPEEAKYIAIYGKYVDIDDFYGLSEPNEPKMVVTQPASLDYGVITESTQKTFTISNTGLATLNGITVTSSNSTVFAVSNAPTSLAAGASQEVTITMSAATTGVLSSDITVSATDMEDVQFTVKGVVLPDGMAKEEFTDGLPSNWTNANWTFANGIATGKSSSAYLTTPKLVIANGDLIVLKARRQDSDTSDYLTVQGSSDNGSTWTAYSKKLQNADGLTYPDFSTIVLSDIPASVDKLRFVGYYAEIDEIWGLNYASVLSVTKDNTAVSTPDSYDFGECAANATVTYNFANTGAGTINITNVAITGDGAAAYSTNWTASTAAPFDLVITRTYDSSRTTAQAATVTVTTSEGNFVINVTGTDKAANAPELSVTPNENADFGVVTAATNKTYTVTNVGTGSLTVNIASDDAKFTVSPATIENIAAGASETFTVTFTPVAETYGVFNANITVTPTYEANAAVTIAASAKVKDPNVWTEDFSDNTLPDGWTIDGENANGYWSFSNGEAVGAWYKNSTHKVVYLITPALEVKAGEEMTFKYKRTGYAGVTVEKQKDGGSWESLMSTENASEESDYTTYTITGLTAGTYKFRFTNDDYVLDDLEGFKLATEKAHAATLLSETIPATGNQYVEYTAIANVKVTGTNVENITVKFFIGNTQIGESQTKSIASGENDTFTFSFTPQTAMSGDAYFTIESNDIAAFESSKTAVTIAAATVYDETVGVDYSGEFADTNLPAVELRYNISQWATIALPFAVSNVEEAFGAGARVYAFTSYNNNVIRLESASSMSAGLPYVLYVANSINNDPIIFTDVTIPYSAKNHNGEITSNGVKLNGTYLPMAAGTITGNYSVTSDGKIAKASANATLKAFRAYFSGIPTNAKLTISIDGEEATGIEAAEILNALTGDVYDLSGRKVNRAEKGIYIQNGKKIVVK